MDLKIRGGCMSEIWKKCCRSSQERWEEISVVQSGNTWMSLGGTMATCVWVEKSTHMDEFQLKVPKIWYAYPVFGWTVHQNTDTDVLWHIVLINTCIHTSIHAYVWFNRKALTLAKNQSTWLLPDSHSNLSQDSSSPLCRRLRRCSVWGKLETRTRWFVIVLVGKSKFLFFTIFGCFTRAVIFGKEVILFLFDKNGGEFWFGKFVSSSPSFPEGGDPSPLPWDHHTRESWGAVTFLRNENV